MGLFERLSGEQGPGINLHGAAGFLGELERGKVTAQQVTNALGLSAGEAVEAQALLAKLVPPRESVSLGSGQFTLTNVGTTYDAHALTPGFGFALVQAAGITQVVFAVKVQKIGTGTQSWQLWNETNASEVAVIDDAAAAGAVKMLSTTVNFDPALGPGIKTVRVRVKSTVAQDDPVYFGAALSIRRVDSLTALELHEVLLCADNGGAYNTAAELKARLGIA
jgi:hypothetical protein